MDTYPLTVSTFSKHPLKFPSGYPQMLVRAYGSKVWDSDGKEYVDFVQGLGGSGIMGHRPEIISKLYEESEMLCVHLPTPVEQEVAALLRGMLPWAEVSRFCLNGTDSTAGAVRLARAVTGRDSVIVFEGSYHGESTGDWSLSAKPGARGLPDLLRKPITLPWNDVSRLRGDLIRGCAAVIFEVANEDPTPEFVAALNSVGSYGTILIADEVVDIFIPVRFFWVRRARWLKLHGQAAAQSVGP